MHAISEKFFIVFNVHALMGHGCAFAGRFRALQMSSADKTVKEILIQQLDV